MPHTDEHEASHESGRPQALPGRDKVRTKSDLKLGRRQLGRLTLEEPDRAVDRAAPRLQPVVHQLDLLLLQHARQHPLDGAGRVDLVDLAWFVKKQATRRLGADALTTLPPLSRHPRGEATPFGPREQA